MEIKVNATSCMHKGPPCVILTRWRRVCQGVSPCAHLTVQILGNLYNLNRIF